jgi:fermentation-respiration switch protein FrsA (DUF1100 family)
MLRWFEHSQIYQPTREVEPPEPELRRRLQEVSFRSRDGVELNGWFFPADPNSQRAHLAVLMCHGNAGNISHRADVYKALLEAGLNVLAFDYRGYGRSAGRPAEEGTYLDGQAAYEWLRLKGFPASNIIAYGESLGGGIASEVALREQVAGLILQSTFSCMVDIGKELFPWLPVRWLATIHYDTCAKLPRIKVPVLVMHSRADELIGFHHGQKNFSIAHNPKLFCELAGEHNAPLSDHARFMEGINGFLSLIGREKAK